MTGRNFGEGNFSVGIACCGHITNINTVVCGFANRTIYTVFKGENGIFQSIAFGIHFCEFKGAEVTFCGRNREFCSSSLPFFISIVPFVPNKICCSVCIIALCVYKTIFFVFNTNFITHGICINTVLISGNIHFFKVPCDFFCVFVVFRPVCIYKVQKFKRFRNWVGNHPFCYSCIFYFYYKGADCIKHTFNLFFFFFTLF